VSVDLDIYVTNEMHMLLETSFCQQQKNDGHKKRIHLQQTLADMQWQWWQRAVTGAVVTGVSITSVDGVKSLNRLL
jgi:hypothetical protein